MTTLRLLLIGGPMYEALYERIDVFAQREGITVDVVDVLPHPDLNERIASAIARDEAFDLISTHSKYAPSQQEWLLPLDEHVDDAELEPFAERTLRMARIDGALYGLPRNLDVKLLHYRNDLLDAPPTSWEQLYDVARAQNGPEHAGFVFPGRESGLFGHFFELQAMAGGELFPDPTSPMPRLRGAPGHWALDLLCRLYHDCAPAELIDWHYDEVARCFRSGGAAISSDWPGAFHTYRGNDSAVAQRFDLALYPPGPAGHFIYGGSHTFANPRSVRDLPASLALLRELSSQDAQLGEARLGTLPGRSDTLALARAECDAGSLQERRWQLLDEACSCALIPPQHASYPLVEDLIWEGLRDCLRHGGEIETTLEAIEARIAEALAQETR